MQCIVLLQLQQALGVFPPPVPAGRPPPGSLQAPHRSAMQSRPSQLHVAHGHCTYLAHHELGRVITIVIINTIVVIVVIIMIN